MRTDGCRTIHVTTAAAAVMSARIVDSESTSRHAPRITPSTTARHQAGWRRSRTAASSVSGRNTVPMAMLISYQDRHVIMDDRPKSAPAAYAPMPDSQSRAARYMA